MSVALLLITHDHVGDALLRTASSTLGVCPLPAACIAVDQDADPDRLVEQGRRLLEELDRGQGVLILTDAYGSTPSNIASCLALRDRIAVVAGLNLPMLLRVMNYPDLPLPALQKKALSGGRDGVLVVEHPQEL